MVFKCIEEIWKADRSISYIKKTFDTEPHRDKTYKYNNADYSLRIIVIQI